MLCDAGCADDRLHASKKDANGKLLVAQQIWITNHIWSGSPHNITLRNGAVQYSVDHLVGQRVWRGVQGLCKQDLRVDRLDTAIARVVYCQSKHRANKRNFQSSILRIGTHPVEAPVIGQLVFDVPSDIM